MGPAKQFLKFLVVNGAVNGLIWNRVTNNPSFSQRQQGFGSLAMAGVAFTTGWYFLIRAPAM